MSWKHKVYKASVLYAFDSIEVGDTYDTILIDTLGVDMVNRLKRFGYSNTGQSCYIYPCRLRDEDRGRDTVSGMVYNYVKYKEYKDKLDNYIKLI